MDNNRVYRVETEIGTVLRDKLTHAEAAKTVFDFEAEDVSNGSYVPGCYYVRNTVTGDRDDYLK